MHRTESIFATVVFTNSDKFVENGAIINNLCWVIIGACASHESKPIYV